MDLDRIAKWEDKFLQGDHSEDTWLLKQLRDSQSIDGVPLFFRVASTVEALTFLRDHGVKLTTPDDTGSTLLMEPEFALDAEVYRWLADEFQAAGAIDLAEEEGFTALSTKIKFGELEKARILLERGAKIDSFATVNRYGGARITIANQAINCIPKDNAPQEVVSISALQLLKDFGYAPARDEAQKLFDDASSRNKPAVRDWIEKELF